MVKRRTGTADSSGLLRPMMSNLVVQHDSISSLITIAMDEAKHGKPTDTKLNGLVLLKSNVKQICNATLLCMHTIFLIMYLCNVKMTQFKKKTKDLFKRDLFERDAKTFLQACSNQHHKFSKKDGQLYITLGSGAELQCDHLIPSLERLVEIILEIFNDHWSNCNKKTKKCVVCLNKEDLKKKYKTISSDNTHFWIDNIHNIHIRQYPLLPKPEPVENEEKDEEAVNNYDNFSQTIKEKYQALKKYMYDEKQVEKPEGEEKQCLIYKDAGLNIQHTFFVGTTEALTWCHKHRELMEKDHTTIFTTNQYHKDRSLPQATRKKKVGRAAVGREPTPSVTASVNVPYSSSEQEPKPELIFFIDTAADGGSVGYNPEFLKDFIFSVENIEDEDKPTVFGEARVKGQCFPIQSFDVDKNPNWNALGMEQIKEFVLLFWPGQNLSVLVDPKNVKVTDRGVHKIITITVPENYDAVPLVLSTSEPSSSSQSYPTEAGASGSQISNIVDYQEVTRSLQTVDDASFPDTTAASSQDTTAASSQDTTAASSL